jgi:hypothetical protein
MAEDYEVGYGKPPKQHRFKAGNQAARKHGRAKKGLELPELMERALRTRRKVKRGDQVYSVPIAEILVERLIQMMTSGSSRDLALVVQMLERYLPDALAKKSEPLEVSYHRAEGSTVSLPPPHLWKGLGQ